MDFALAYFIQFSLSVSSKSGLMDGVALSDTSTLSEGMKASYFKNDNYQHSFTLFQLLKVFKGQEKKLVPS